MSPEPAGELANGRPPRSARVLVVDDDADVRCTLVRVLEKLGHEVEQASDGPQALAALSLDIDLVLLDASMPGIDGFEVARRIRQDPQRANLPIVMVTGLDSRQDRLRAVEAGVNDFIAKPFDVTELRVRTASLLRMKEATDALKRHRAELEQTVVRRTAELRHALDETVAARQRIYDAHVDTIRRLVLAAESKDRDTAAHIERIGRYCGLLGEGLGLSPGEVDVLRWASQMHDVGKLGVPDAILVKPGKLNPEEWELMKQHPVIGARMLRGSSSELLQAGERIALTHHEKWDGSGYPAGLRGEAIPLDGRICAVADVFDALTSARPYRAAMSTETVFAMLAAERGRHFDPRVLDAFLSQRPAVEAVAEALRDGREKST